MQIHAYTYPNFIQFKIISRSLVKELIKIFILTVISKWLWVMINTLTYFILFLYYRSKSLNSMSFPNQVKLFQPGDSRCGQKWISIALFYLYHYIKYKRIMVRYNMKIIRKIMIFLNQKNLLLKKLMISFFKIFWQWRRQYKTTNIKFMHKTTLNNKFKTNQQCVIVPLCSY